MPKVPANFNQADKLGLNQAISRAGVQPIHGVIFSDSCFTRNRSRRLTDRLKSCPTITMSMIQG